MTDLTEAPRPQPPMPRVARKLAESFGVRFRTAGCPCLRCRAMPACRRRRPRPSLMETDSDDWTQGSYTPGACPCLRTARLIPGSVIAL